MNRLHLILVAVFSMLLAGAPEVSARVYNAETGRFFTRDRLGQVDGPNLYQYARSRPVTMRDPTGLVAAVCSGTSAWDFCQPTGPTIELPVCTTWPSPNICADQSSSEAECNQCCFDGQSRNPTGEACRLPVTWGNLCYAACRDHFPPPPTSCCQCCGPWRHSPGTGVWVIKGKVSVGERCSCTATRAWHWTRTCNCPASLRCATNWISEIQTLEWEAAAWGAHRDCDSACSKYGMGQLMIPLEPPPAVIKPPCWETNPAE
jgi:hypothetical protein